MWPTYLQYNDQFRQTLKDINHEDTQMDMSDEEYLSELPFGYFKLWL